MSVQGGDSWQHFGGARMGAPQVREFASTVAKCKAARRARTARALMKHDSKHPVHEHEALLLCAESKWGKKKPPHARGQEGPEGSVIHVR